MEEETSGKAQGRNGWTDGRGEGGAAGGSPPGPACGRADRDVQAGDRLGLGAEPRCPCARAQQPPARAAARGAGFQNERTPS